MKNTLNLATLGLGLALLPGLAQANVTIRGSDTMLIMNQRLAEAFNRTNPNVAINVTGGGSSIGIRSFINGTANIAASSRPMRRGEVSSARSRGAVANEIPIALDGLAIIVHKDNPVASLTMDQLRRIYIGQVSNWSQVGGPNLPVVALSRDTNSGTFAFFQGNVLRSQNWGKGVRFLPSTADILRETGNTRGAIGYGGVAYFKDNPRVRIVPVARAAGSPPLAPTEENVRSRQYPIWRFLYFYTNGRPSGETRRFIDFALSTEGQRVIEEVGFYSLRPR